MSLSSTQQNAISQADGVWEINEIAEGLCKAKDLKNAKLVYKEAIKKATGTNDFVTIADSVIGEDYLNDQDFGREIYQRGLDAAVDPDDIKSVGDAVGNEWKLNDKDWARKIYKEGIESARSFNNLLNYAESLAYNLGDKDLAKSIYKKAEQRAFEPYNYQRMAVSVLNENNLDDKNWAKELFKKGIENAHTTRELIDLSRAISSEYEMNDKKWGRAVIELAHDKAKTRNDVEGVAEHYASKIDDKDVAKDIYLKAVNLAREYSDYRALAGSVLNEDHLNDTSWAKELYKNAIEKAISLDHLEYIADDVESDYYLNDAAFSDEIKKMDNPILTAAVERKLSEKIQKMVKDAGELYEVRDTANELCESDKESAKKIYELCESLSHTPDELTNLAQSVIDEDYLNDKKWAVDLFQKAIDTALDSDEMRSVAESISGEWRGLNDKKLGKEIFTKSLELADEFNGLKNIADSVCSEDYLNDKDWGRKVYDMAKSKAQTANDYVNLAQAYSDEDLLNDNKTAKELLEIAIERSDEDNNQYQCIAETISENRYLGDKDWARAVYRMALNTASRVWDYSSIAESVLNENYLNDKGWAREIFQLAVEKAENQDELDSIADSIEREWGFNDPKWAKEIRAGKGGSPSAQSVPDPETEPDAAEIIDDVKNAAAEKDDEKPTKGKRASGKKGFAVSGRMSVGRFEKEFDGAFGITVQVKKGGRYAPDGASLASLRPDNFKGPKKIDLSVRGNMKVSRLKQVFNESFGLNLQVYDGNRVASDGETLASIRKQ